jgi:hypothetical protein
LSGIGYEWQLDRAVVIHTASLIGLDYQTFEVAPRYELFADGTIDYDGQWRVRAGIAIGQPINRNMR